jgi:hypothetical protein
MKTLVSICVLVLVLATAAFAQEAPPEQFAGTGVAWNQFASPQINGMAVFAKRIAGDSRPMYSFSAVNFVSAQARPFRLLTTTETGIAQYLTAFGPFAVYGIGTTGLAAGGTDSGTSTGAVFSGGGLALAGIGKGWRLGPYFRVIKPTISDRQWAAGLMLGWGR